MEMMLYKFLVYDFDRAMLKKIGISLRSAVLTAAKTTP